MAQPSSSMTDEAMRLIARSVFDAEPPADRLTPADMIAMATRVRQALTEAGATETDRLRYLASWLRDLDKAPATTAEERMTAIQAAASGFGLEMRLLGDGRCLFSPIRPN
jgi:hypothetical protein